MDLTKRFPRSPRERLVGIAMLARTIDKARAYLAGTLGEYIFDCPMDKQLFAALGVDERQFAGAVRDTQTDADVLAHLRAVSAFPHGAALETHNRAIDAWAPKSDEGRRRFEQQRGVIAPGRTDILTWTDLIEVEEGRLARQPG